MDTAGQENYFRRGSCFFFLYVQTRNKRNYFPPAGPQTKKKENHLLWGDPCLKLSKVASRWSALPAVISSHNVGLLREWRRSYPAQDVWLV